jgi:hypothetical protein
MKITTGLILSIVLTIGAAWAGASSHTPRTGTIIVSRAALPQQAEDPSQDLFLYSNKVGNAYLYLEQRNGAQLSVLDVTEPDDIRLDAVVETGLSKPYTFVEPVGESVELIRFRDGSGDALLNLHKPKAPRISLIQGDVALSAPTSCLTSQSSQPETQDVRITGAESAKGAIVVPHVIRQATRKETGTTFLLNDRGLTVVRRLGAEWEYIQVLGARANGGAE